MNPRSMFLSLFMGTNTILHEHFCPTVQNFIWSLEGKCLLFVVLNAKVANMPFTNN